MNTRHTLRPARPGLSLPSCRTFEKQNCENVCQCHGHGVCPRPLRVYGVCVGGVEVGWGGVQGVACWQVQHRTTKDFDLKHNNKEPRMSLIAGLFYVLDRPNTPRHLPCGTYPASLPSAHDLF